MKKLIALLLILLLSGTSQSQPIKNCPPEGKGGDSKLNVKKNRTDSPASSSIETKTLTQIAGMKKSEPSDWQTGNDRSSLESKGEGNPVQVAGFLLKAKQEGKESCNCGLTGVDNTDLHLALGIKSSTAEKNSVTAEITPRIRLAHPGWTKQKLNAIVRDKMHVRLTGFLLLDTQHVNNPFPRATNWEIHPITELEIEQDGSWITLDNFKP